MLGLPANASPEAQCAPAGFAPAAQNLWTPLLLLGASGDPGRAFAAIDRMLPFDRKILLHPLLSSRLASVETRLPPHQTTLLRAASLYADPAIPWQTTAAGVHFIAVEGRPAVHDYRYDLTTNQLPPSHLGDFSSRFSLQPAQPGANGEPSSVVARLAGSILVGDFNPSQALATAAAILREIHGTLAPPWDPAPGDFNSHDRALLARIARDMPALSEQIDRYLIIDNLLDEFTDKSGPYVLYNLDLQLRDVALAPFPHLRNFYRMLTRLAAGTSITRDLRGRQWLRLAFADGHFHVIFMLRGGALVPFDGQLRPAGEPLSLTALSGGQFETDTSAWVNRFNLRFGLAHIRYRVTYRHQSDAIGLSGHLREPPTVLAPPLVHSIVLLIAGRFLTTLATGNSGHGVVADLSAEPTPAGGTLLAHQIEGELLYSPALEVLARIGDEVAAANNAKVLADERALLGEFLGAAHRDYLRAQPALRATAGSAKLGPGDRDRDGAPQPE